MKKSQNATSIIEAMIVMLIVVSWVIWMYNIYNQSTKLSNTTKNRIEAIEIAREWIEAMKNIRDTNWLLFWADNTNCWNVLNYNSSCVWDAWITSDISSWSYIIYQGSDNRWKLDSRTTWAFWTWYINRFEVQKDLNWLYTQTWWTAFNPIFTREIKIFYPNNHKMSVTSLVQWVDNSSLNPHKVELNLELNNWAK